MPDNRGRPEGIPTFVTRCLGRYALFLTQLRTVVLHTALRRYGTKTATGLALIALVVWLAVDSSNPWQDPHHLERVTAQVREIDLVTLRDDMATAIRAVHPSANVNLNGRWDRNSINVYLLESTSLALPGWGAGGASYQPRHDVLLIDKHVVWPYVTGPSYAAAATVASQERSASDRLWLQFVLLHELGHRTLHRDVKPTAITDELTKRRLEDEADAFAFEHLANLVSQARPSYERDGLLSRRRIAELPEPDRSAALIASLIQEFSVNLLFSNATISTYHSDPAHKAFVERFKPRIRDLLLRTTTKEGRIFVLLAWAAIERVAEAGRSIVAEIATEAPIASVSFTEKGLRINVTHKPDPLELVATEIPRASFMHTGPLPVRIRLDTNGATAEEAPRTGHSLSAPTPIEANVWPSDWAPGLRTMHPSEDVLVGLLLKEYGGEINSCAAGTRDREYPFLDVLFICDRHFFAARFDVEDRELSDVVEILSPERWSRKEGSNDVFRILDTRLDGERLFFFVQNTLSDARRRGAHQLRLWKATNGLPRLLGSIDLLTDWIPADTSIRDWFTISHPPMLTCGLSTDTILVCTEFLDSIFQIDLRTGKGSVLFYPAGVYKALDGEGYYAFYASGGFKLFIARVGP